MKKHSSIERVVGKIPDAEKEHILREFEEQFDNQKFEGLLAKERAKTPEELKIINLVNEITNKARNKYGLDDLDIPAKNIHIIKEKDWQYRGPAFYDSDCQAVVMREQSSPIVFAKKVLHEMLHFKSYNAMQITLSDNPRLTDYRVGLNIYSRDGKKRFFANLNEAVTEEMVKRVLPKLYDNALLKDEVKQTREIAQKYPETMMSGGQPLFDGETFYAKIKHKSWDEKLEKNKILFNTEKFAYTQERKILNTLIDKIFVRNHNKFNDREQVFEVFAQGIMTGNIMTIGHLIDNAFGKGTLRKIGELDRDVSAQAKFVESL